jgi:hypothetical protein
MRLSGSIAPAIKKHPISGMAIEPLWVRPDGRVCWPMMGGAPEDSDDDGDNGKVDDTGDSGAGGDDGDKDKDDKDSDDTISKEEFERLEKRMKAADKRAADAEKKLQEQEDAKKDDLTRTNDELESARKQIEELQGTIKSLRLNNTFLTANTHSWHDSEAALDLADSKGYLADVIDDDGEVDKKALGKALDKLAKDKPYLVKPKDKDDDGDGEPSGHGGPRRSDNNQDTSARKATLKKRFPALQNR